MPKKGFKHSEETKKKMSLAKKGKIAHNHNYKIDKWVENNKNKHFCLCGCGKAIKLNRRKHYWDGIPKYLHGHNVKHKLPKHLQNKSEMTKKKISDSLKKAYKEGKVTSYYKGQSLPKELKCKLSLSHGGTGVPYENTEYPKEFHYIKEQIRKRDNYTCQNCGKTQVENGKKLDVHHIDYNKKNCRKDNLISLCRTCHVITNSNRKYWEKYFQGGQYVK